MRKINLALIGGALVLVAAPALASITLLGPYKSKGECNSFINGTEKDYSKGANHNYWLANGYTLSCQAINGKYFVVAD
jgi:hypothetical protein